KIDRTRPVLFLEKGRNQAGVFVGIDGQENNIRVAFEALFHLLVERVLCPAWAAPSSPKIKDDNFVAQRRQIERRYIQASQFEPHRVADAKIRIDAFELAELLVDGSGSPIVGGENLIAQPLFRAIV